MIAAIPLLWRWLGGALIVVLIFGGIYLKGRSDGKAVIQAELDAQRATWQQQYDAQVAETKRVEGEWKTKAEETERDLHAKLADVTSAADDLAVSLRHYRARRCAVPNPAGSAAEPDGTGRESGDGEPVEAALGDHVRACARDAERLTAFQEFYRGLRSAGLPIE